MLDEGDVPVFPRTMYRLLAAGKEVRERRDQARHPTTHGPSCWRHGPTRSGAGTSPSCWGRRSGPTSTSTSSSMSSAATSSAGWSPHGRAELASDFIAETAAKQGIEPGPAYAACRPRQLDDVEAGGVAARRPGHHQEPFAAVRLRTTTPTPKASSRRSSTGRTSPTASRRLEQARAFCRAVLRLVQRRASSQRHRLAHAGGAINLGEVEQAIRDEFEETEYLGCSSERSYASWRDAAQSIDGPRLP